MLMPLGIKYPVNLSLTHLFRQSLQLSASITVLHLLHCSCLAMVMRSCSALSSSQALSFMLDCHSFSSQCILWLVTITMLHTLMLYLFLLLTVQ
jgi:hypothetical protein